MLRGEMHKKRKKEKPSAAMSPRKGTCSARTAISRNGIDGPLEEHSLCVPRGYSLFAAHGPHALILGFRLDLTHVLDTVMPTYEYRREDGTTFEIQQRITEDPLETCPETGQKVERIISGGSGLIFKGEGFYVNDYGKSSSNGAAASSNGASDTSDTSEATAESSSDSTDAED